MDTDEGVGGRRRAGQQQKRWHWPRGTADPRLLQEIGELEVRLQDAFLKQDADGLDRTNAIDDSRRTAVEHARKFLCRARSELVRHWAGNEAAWAWFHVARREALHVWSNTEIVLLEIDLRQEVRAKLSTWRLKAVDRHYSRTESVLDRVVKMQEHLDETAENDNRKRLLQRRQMVIYLAFLVAVLLVICLLEFVNRGLLVMGASANGWWVISSVLYGTLGGAFSSAQRVAAAGPAQRFPGLRWAQLANIFRPMAGGAGALVAFAALQADVFGSAAGTSGPSVALVCFVAGFSERFIPSLAARQEPSS